MIEEDALTENMSKQYFWLLQIFECDQDVDDKKEEEVKLIMKGTTSTCEHKIRTEMTCWDVRTCSLRESWDWNALRIPSCFMRDIQHPVQAANATVFAAVTCYCPG